MTVELPPEKRIALLLGALALAACDPLLGSEPPRPTPDAAMSASQDAGGLTPSDAGVPSAPDGGPSGDAGCASPSYPCDKGCCRRLVAAGGDHACATDEKGDVYCWGDYGVAPKSAVPTRVAGAANVKFLAAGWGFTCAIDGNRTLACWGTNGFGELGTGTHSIDPIWTATPSALGAPALGAGGGKSHGCAIASDGALACWGMNDYDQLGLGTSTGYQATPQPVSWSKAAVGIAAGWKNTCAVAAGGALYCWGHNGLGELGDATMVARKAPWPVASLQTGVTAIAVGALHVCAVKDKKVFCWGDNGNHQVIGAGTGCSTDLKACFQPNDVGLSGAVDVVAGAAHTCALLETGKVSCWGANDAGQLGNDDASTADALGPKEVFGLADVGMISAGLDHTCAVRKDQIWCWGANDAGQLARPSATAESRRPVLVTW